MTASTRVWTPIDFDTDGRQEDCLRVPYSTDVSAYGWIPVPLVCLRNGEGPTALLIAGSHGDEYEGQIALLNLVRDINLDDLRGRIVVLPALNFPAVQAGSRVSPLDQGNLNRAFPGNPHGTPTQMIAHYVTEILIPMADLVVDLHSGGRSLHYLPSALIRPGRTRDEHALLLALLKVFGAPISFISDGTGGGGVTTLAAAAEERGVVALTTELGGGATLCAAGLALAETGVKRLLKHLGVLPAITVPAPAATRFMTVEGRDAFLYARSRGIFEPSAIPGDHVARGDVAGMLHHFDWPGRQPEQYIFNTSGVVACRRALSLTEPGDCLFQVISETEPSIKLPRPEANHARSPLPMAPQSL